MKQIIFILSVLLLWSCSEEDIPNNNTISEEEYVTVNIKLGGEILDVTQEPMTKGLTNNDLTAIQINEVVMNDYEEEVPYAWGLFDDVSNISVKLKKGSKYDIEATTVINGKSIMRFTEEGYCDPFILNNKCTFVTNNMDISSTCSFQALNMSNVYLKKYNGYGYQYSNADKFYYTNVFVAEEWSGIDLDMKRVSAGLKVITNNLTGGKLLIESRDFPHIEINPGEEYDEIYTIPWYVTMGMENKWGDDDCKTSSIMTFTYQDASGEKTQIASQKIEFTRNKKTVITVNIPDDEEIGTQKNAIKVSLDDTPMVDGDKITVG